MDFSEAVTKAAPLLLGMAAQMEGRDPQGLARGAALMGAEAEKARRKEAVAKMMGQMGLGQSEMALLDTLPVDAQQSYLINVMNDRRAMANRAPSAASIKAAQDARNAAMLGEMFGRAPQPTQAPSVQDALATPVSLTEPQEPLQFKSTRAANPVQAGLDSAEGLGFGAMPVSQPVAQPAAQGRQPRFPREYYDEAIYRFTMAGNDALAKRVEVLRDIDHPPAAEMSAREAKIAGLMSTGLDRNRAVGIVDGRFQLANTGDVVDVATGNLVEPPSPTLANEAGFGDQPHLSFPASVPKADYRGAFGAEGFARNVANTFIDAVPGSVPIPFPEANTARTALTNTALRTVTTLQESFPGRASVQLMQKLEDVAARPGQILNGEASAIDTLTQTAEMIRGFVREEQRKIDNPRGYTPQQRAMARERIDRLIPLLADYESILSQVGSGGPTADDAALIDKWLK